MILLYHKVHPTVPSMWWVSVDAFRRQMSSLAAYQVVTLDDYDPRNPRHVVITFDGVYENVLKYAAPVLAQYGYPFELFVTGAYIGQDNSFDQPKEPPARFTSMEDLQRLTRMGGRLQWHSWSHAKMSALSPAELDRELTVPAELRGTFPAPHFRWFAYPHGEHSQAVIDAVKSGFAGALSCVAGDDEDRYALNRVTALEASNFSSRRVSVIIPNYNYSAFLQESVESVLMQTVPPDEILIIDDASTDGSQEVIAQFADVAKIVLNETNLGIVENFRKAVSLTSGDYIAFVGADNRMRSDYVQLCAEALDRHADAAVAYTDMSIFGWRAGVLAESVGARKVGSSRGEQWDVYHWEFPEPTPDVVANMMNKNFIHGSSMFRRIDYDRVGGYRSTDQAEDKDLFTRMLAQGRSAIHVRAPIIEYRQHSAAQANTVLSLEMRSARLLAETRSLKTEVASLKTEVASLKAETKTLRKALRNVHAQHRANLIRAAVIDGEARKLKRKLAKRPVQKLKNALKNLTRLNKPHQKRYERDLIEQVVAWHIRVLHYSGLFDYAHYRQQIATKPAPKTMKGLIAHYLSAGTDQQFDPSPHFSTAWYVSSYGDRIPAGTAPLLHYIMKGEAEGLRPNPSFDPTWYCERYPSVDRTRRGALVNYLQSGLKAGHRTNGDEVEPPVLA
jgi:glycosyltransferase involved in cell wall biosynthesis